MKKFIIALIGGTVLLVGLALLVLPGPGLPIVAGGFAILATEFFWAKRAMRRAKGAVARIRRESGFKDWLARFRSPQKQQRPTLDAEMQLTEPNKTGIRASTFLALAAWLAVSFSAALMGGFFTPGEWFAALNKPTWNPPGWVFGPVWSALYTMMGVAAWLVWRQGGWAKQRKPLLIFLAQLALNAAWTPLFFGLHQPGLALLDIVLLWLAIIVTIAAFWRVHRTAAALLVPYLAWVSFATFLNFTIWRLNS